MASELDLQASQLQAISISLPSQRSTIGFVLDQKLAVGRKLEPPMMVGTIEAEPDSAVAVVMVDLAETDSL
ncbi:hypothetical protein MHYP_G00348780 [Metynnis hypsauchen]